MNTEMESGKEGQTTSRQTETQRHLNATSLQGQSNIKGERKPETEAEGTDRN